MAELLLELFSEEIPAKIQKTMADALCESVKTVLSDEAIGFSSAESFVTPRRIGLVINGLPKSLEDKTIEKKGPRIGSPANAIDGFLRSVGLSSVNELEKREVGKAEFYFAIVKQEAKPLAITIADVVGKSIQGLTWPKSMKWSDHTIRWTRPLHSIICLLDGKILPLNFGHITASNITKGHRFLSEGEFSVSSYEDYKNQLKSHFVILDREERKAIIIEQAANLVKEYGLIVRNDEDLLDEVAGLVEWPVVLLGNINQRFIKLPPEVLITSMRTHQKYFSVHSHDSNIAPYFIAVSNITASDGGTKIICGYERVLNARLEDAKFFWDQDRRHGLEENIIELEKIIFHARLGTIAEKTKRMAELAKLLAVWVPHASLVMVERAALLSKADLVSQMVGEFPELQGLMGYYYALESKENQEVALAIKEHYSPVGPNDECPKQPVSVAVALADKVDTLVGLFAIDEKPTGSKDPYALRRAALGVIRLIIENKLRIPLKILFEKSLNKYPKSLLKEAKDHKSGKRPNENEIINDLLSFFADRLRFLLKSENVRYDLIEAVFDNGREDDLTRLVSRVRALENFVSSEDGINLLAAYKRAINIVLAEEKKDNTQYKGEPEKNILEAVEEKSLFEKFTNLRSELTKSLKDENYAQVMESLAKLRQPVDKFFDNVVVNCDNPAIRKNRLLMLAQFREFLNNVANFSKIETLKTEIKNEHSTYEKVGI